MTTQDNLEGDSEIINSPESELENVEISLLLDGIYNIYGYDFRGYTRAYIRRRILHRLRIEKLLTISALLGKVLHEPAYMDRLFNDFSINVTEMFRDPKFYHLFRTQIIPLLENYPEIRIWHAGCSTGEEAYSMAILIEELGLAHKTKIYATDINEQAIEVAKKGVFPLKRMQVYTRNYFEAGGSKAFSEYYSTDENSAFIHPHLKGNLMFAQHNLVTDGSFNDFHMIFCRNVLIYFNNQLQNRVHELLYQSLIPQGFLGLGSKESLLFTGRSIIYEEFYPTQPIYRKINGYAVL